MMKNIVFAFTLALLFGCGKKQKGVDYSKKSSTTQVATEHLGEKLLEQKCYVCHSPTASHDARVAPPMIAIKAHYINESTSKKEFTKKFVNFVTNPTRANAQMRGAVRRFGVMPKQLFKEEDLKQIAEYLYEYQIEEPSWFKKHWQEMQGKSYINSGKKSAKVDTKKTPADIGLKYALGTKKVLGKNLMGTIQKKGTLEALQFCNEKAYPLTDSMAVQYNATIKRVSDKPRNPNNSANEKEIAIINQYKKMVVDQADIKPITETIDGKTQFYYPIVTNSMCLQCHGKPNNNIQPVTLEKLLELYPKDKATGYTENQVRGIWSITFNH